MLLLTPKKAKALLTVGDTVYFVRNGAVQRRTVKAILKDDMFCSLWRKRRKAK